MSRFLSRSTIANISKIVRNAASVSVKSEQCLGTACLMRMRTIPAMMQSSVRNYSLKEIDREFAECLKEEIGFEEEVLEKVSNKIGNFNVIKMDGAEVELTGRFEGEEVKITFNVNGSLEDISQEENPTQEEEPQLVAKPTFTVEFDRMHDKNLLVQCAFLDEETIAALEDQPSFDIQMFAMVNRGEGVSEATYTCYNENMDENIHSYLMSLLEKRGVDRSFATDLQAWAENYERTRYHGLLKSLKDFVSK